MGNDGGSIPTRRELVKEPTRQKTHSQVRDSAAQTQSYRWTTCPLSKRPLAAPVVSDWAGRLYNKDSIIDWLLRGTEAFGDGAEVLKGRILSLKDVVEVKFELLQTDISKPNHMNGSQNMQWVCPVSRKELGPGVKSVYLVPCGHAFSDTAVKEVGETGCLICNLPYESTNAIPINPSEPSDMTRLQDRLKDLTEMGLTHSLKKITLSKKTKKRKLAISKAENDSKKKRESVIKNATTAGLTAKVLEDENARHKQRRLEMSTNVKSLFSGTEIKPGKNNDFMSRGYSLPSN